MPTLMNFAITTGLTVGSVASLIALCIFLIKFLSPQIIVFIYSALLGDRNTAATWTVAGRTLHGTYWPEVLRTDSALSSNVSRTTAITSKLLLLINLLIFVAGIVTPLGLYEGIWPDKATIGSFEYASDPSVFGQGTPARSALGFNRQCGNLIPAPCPLSNTTVTVVGNQTKGQYDAAVDGTVPPVLLESYSAGTAGTTVSSCFDIEWRQWSTKSDITVDNGKPYLTGSLRQITSLVLNNAIQPVEGLIVNTISGGVGFRNHTVPSQVQQSTYWTEDLLFIEPQSVCVNNNLTLDFIITGNSSIGRVVMTDRGGFAGLNKTYPAYPFNNFIDPQSDPILAFRAYKAAWLTNVYTMLYLNVTNPHDEKTDRKAFSYMQSEIGREFELQTASYDNKTGPFNAITLSAEWGGKRGLMGELYPRTMDSGTMNPFDITSENFTSINMLCEGAGGGDKANISNIAITCGLMFGAAQRNDAGSGLIFEEGSNWTMPIYSCATTAKASVKVVSFNQTATPGLNGLSVTSIQDKTYSQPEDAPLWGVEDSGMNFSQIQPLWGLVTPEAAAKVKMYTRQGPSLYLPGFWDPLASLVSPIGSATDDSLPGARFHSTVAKAVFTTKFGGDTSSPGIDYTGFTNLAMWSRWQELSASAANASQILNLIWTDYAASMVVGTKGTLGPSNAGPAIPITVTPSVARVSYNWPYAIPALFVALLFLLSMLTALGAAVTGRASFGALRRHLHQTSSGRIFTACLGPQTAKQDGVGGDDRGENAGVGAAFATSGRQWMKGQGGRLVDLQGGVPVVTGAAEGHGQCEGEGSSTESASGSDASAVEVNVADESAQPLKSEGQRSGAQ